MLEKTLESPLDSKEIKPVHPKGNKSWIFFRVKLQYFSHVMFTRKDPDAAEDWGQEEKGTTGWDGWMASPTQWTWVWINSGRWWWTGRPGVLQPMGSQRVGHDWAVITTTNFRSHQSPPKRLLTPRFLELLPCRGFDSACLWWGLSICVSISNNFPNNAYAADQGSTLSEPLIYEELWKNSLKIKIHHEMNYTSLFRLGWQKHPTSKHLAP